MNAPDDDPYLCLGISPGASLSEIRRAYKSAVQRSHPDRNPSPQAHSEFLKVQWAYRTLLEAPLESDRQTPSYEQPVAADEPSPPPETLTPMGPQEGDATVFVYIPIGEAGVAHERVISAKLAQPCAACEGQAHACQSCGGTGQVLISRKWRVIIPARTLDGSWIIGSQLGHRGSRFGKAGDVRVQVKWEETGSWRWDEGRLVVRVVLTSRKMKKGGTHAIRMPDGKWVWWTVPPGTIKGQEFQWGQIQWAGMNTLACIVVERGWSIFSPRGRRPVQQ